MPQQDGPEAKVLSPFYFQLAVSTTECSITSKLMTYDLYYANSYRLVYFYWLVYDDNKHWLVYDEIAIHTGQSITI